jgi:rare lipoprotein A (peptidoglycan hydrolase)
LKNNDVLVGTGQEQTVKLGVYPCHSCAKPPSRLKLGDCRRLPINEKALAISAVTWDKISHLNKNTVPTTLGVLSMIFRALAAAAALALSSIPAIASTTLASYYSEPQRLASGGRFNPSGLTAAHKTLPFGTKVRVTNKRNGRSVVVTVNDRGPYVRGRGIDLSLGAARAIGMTGAGVVPVSIQVL